MRLITTHQLAITLIQKQMKMHINEAEMHHINGLIIMN